MIKMIKMIKIILKFIFYSSILLSIVLFWTITFGQSINIEFKDPEFASNYYHYIFSYSPIILFFTLVGTIKKKHTLKRKISTILITSLLVLTTYIYLFQNMFSIGFGAWKNIEILYRNKNNKSEEIILQQYDAGALGYGSNRIVEINDFMFFFKKINDIDTLKVDKNNWQRINIKVDEQKF